MAGIMDEARSRIETIRSRVTSREGTSGQGALESVRERIAGIRGKGLAGAQGGIVERIGGRFPALKRMRGQVEPFERPALFERGLLREKTHKDEVVAGRQMRPPGKSAIF